LYSPADTTHHGRGTTARAVNIHHLKMVAAAEPERRRGLASEGCADSFTRGTRTPGDNLAGVGIDQFDIDVAGGREMRACALVLVIALLQFLAESFIARQYAIAQVFVTRSR
jgi:hypothetical protein